MLSVIHKLTSRKKFYWQRYVKKWNLQLNQKMEEGQLANTIVTYMGKNLA
jgi:hypothetical protein